MSHFAKIQMQFKSEFKTQLVEALETQYDTVESHEEPVDLLTYFGEPASKQSKNGGMWAPKCELVVRRKTLETKMGRSLMVNDMGFAKSETGNYDIYADLDGVPRASINLIMAEYSARVAEKKLRAEGYQTKRLELPDGKLQVIGSSYR